MPRTPLRAARRHVALALSLLVATALPIPVAIGRAPVAEAASSGFVGLTPARLWDTRSGSGTGTVDNQFEGTGRLGPKESFIVMVRGRGGVPDSSNVRSVAVNVTAIDPSADSFLTAYPATYPRPTASNLNTAPGRTLPNMAIVVLSDLGRIEVYNEAGTTDVVLDVLGWFDRSGAFNGINPDRLMDTRSGTGISTVDGDFVGGGRIGPRATARLDVAGRGDVPATGVGAVALNVTAVDPDALSFITVFPAGATRPTASNLNTAPGRTLPNMVIVPVPASGKIDIYNHAGSTHVVVDVLGWFADGDDSLQPLTPARIWETRTGPGLTTVDGRQQGTGRLGPNVTRTIPVAGRAGIPETGVNAVALNVTAVDPDALSFLSVWPTGQRRPDASNLNNAPGRTLPNMVIVPVSADGSIDVYNLAGTTDVVIDVLGWFPGFPLAPQSGDLYYSGVNDVRHTDLVRLVEVAGPEVIDRDTEFAVNADATEFVYAVDGGTTMDVVIADLQTGDQKDGFVLDGFVEGWSRIAPSPDDQLYAAIISDSDDVFGPSQLVIHDRDGVQVDFLDNTRTYQWAPDGSLIVIADPLLSGTWTMYVVPTTGSAWAVATFAREFDDLPTDIAVSPDQSLIVYADQAALYAVPYEGGEAPERIVESAAPLGEPTFSPDGRSLALSRDGDSGFLLRCDGIYVVPVVAPGDPVYLIGGDTDPFKLFTLPSTRVTSCGNGMRWVE